jgi:hypothetical protein
MREGKRLFGRRRHRWEDNIKLIYEEVVQKCVGSIQLVKDGGQMVGFCETRY